MLGGGEGIIPRIVQRQAIESLRNAVGRKAADCEAATARASGVVVLEADAWNQVDDVVDRLPRPLAANDFLVENLLRLRRIRNDDAADVLRRRTRDADFVVELERDGQLGTASCRERVCRYV